MRELTVLTYNLLSPAHADWPHRRELIRSELRRVAPDVVALQECARTAEHDDAEDLLGAEYQTLWHSRRSDDGVGAVLASRHPLRLITEIDLRLTSRVTLPWSAAVLAEVALPPPLGPMLVVHHKPTYEVGYSLEREAQAVASARAIERELARRPRHCVVLGDFDDTPDSASLRFWTGRQSLDGISVAYQDAWASAHPTALPIDSGLTFTPVDPLVSAGEMSLERGRRIDYVLVRCGIHGPSLDVTDFRLFLDEPVDRVWASDHFGVLARLALPKHPPGAWI